VRERLPPTDPREWLNRARSNLAQARVRCPEVYLEDLCFNAQQAAEKAIKALLIAHGVRFPYVHDIGLLLTLLEGAGIPVPEDVANSSMLTQYAVAARYPWLTPPVEEDDYRRAVSIAERVLQWVGEQLVGNKSVTDKERSVP